MSAELGAKQNWIDSQDLDMLYRGPFGEPLYRRPRAVVHNEFRMRKSAGVLARVPRREAPAQPADGRVRRGEMPMTIDHDHLQRVAQAFSDKARAYETFGTGHPNLERMRGAVYAHVERHLQAGARILELNAGTGIDAAHFAALGYRVHATDIAPGMLAAIREKTARSALDGRLTAQALSFTELALAEGAPFDYVFSNFGGLNCIDDLAVVARQLPAALRPRGRLTWVIMPPVCPWDLALALRGQFRQATRRLRPGEWANVAGVRFAVRYFTPGHVLAALGKDFRLLDLEGLSILAPPADRKQFALRHPHVYRGLVWLDARLARAWPFRACGDFFILTAEYRP